MSKRFLVTIIALLAITAPNRVAHAALSIATEDQLHQYLDQITSGQLTPQDCLDPNPDYTGKYCYLEIVQPFKLTKPISIPGYVHLVGKLDGSMPTLTFYYDVSSYPDGTDRCLISFDGDSVILENVKVDARNYFTDSNQALLHDSAICMKSNFSFVHNVAITTPTGINFGTILLAATDGITISGHNNVIQNNNITLRFGDGIVVNGLSNIITKNTISTLDYGIIFNTTNLDSISQNNVTGKTAFLFQSNAKIPIGQAANAILYNTTNDTDLNDATTNPLAYTVEYKTNLPLTDCGTCKGLSGQEKVGYNDDGTCKTIPESGACFEHKAKFPSTYTLTKPSALVNQNAPTPTSPGAISGTVPSTGSVVTTPTPSVGGTDNASPSYGGGGCSLLRSS